jgi:hypothetical protein
MEDKRVILWVAVLLRAWDVGKRDQGIVADDRGKNDTFIALWFDDILPQAGYPMHSYER